jgi:hypothetical protein
MIMKNSTKPIVFTMTNLYQLSKQKFPLQKLIQTNEENASRNI